MTTEQASLQSQESKKPHSQVSEGGFALSEDSLSRVEEAIAEGKSRLRSVKLLSDRGNVHYTGLGVACTDTSQLESLPSVMRPKSKVVGKNSHVNSGAMLSFDEFDRFQQLHATEEFEQFVARIDSQRFKSILEHIRKAQMNLTHAVDSKNSSGGSSKYLDKIAQYKMQLIKEALALSNEMGVEEDVIANNPDHALAQGADSIAFSDKKDTPAENPLRQEHGDYLDKLAQERRDTAQTEAVASGGTKDMGFDLLNVDFVHPPSSDAPSSQRLNVRAKGDFQGDTGVESIQHSSEPEPIADMGLESIQAVPDQDPLAASDEKYLVQEDPLETDAQERAEQKGSQENMLSIEDTIALLGEVEVEVSMTPDKIKIKIGDKVEALTQSIMAVAKEKRFTENNVYRTVQSLQELSNAIDMISVNARKNNIKMKKYLAESLYQLSLTAGLALKEGEQLHQMLKPESRIEADAGPFKAAYAQLIHQLAEGFNF